MAKTKEPTNIYTITLIHESTVKETIDICAIRGCEDEDCRGDNYHTDDGSDDCIHELVQGWLDDLPSIKPEPPDTYDPSEPPPTDPPQTLEDA